MGENAPATVDNVTELPLGLMRLRLRLEEEEDRDSLGRGGGKRTWSAKGNIETSPVRLDLFVSGIYECRQLAEYKH